MKLANDDLESGVRGGSVAALKGLGRMFYAIDPEETTYETVQQVPNFIQQVMGLLTSGLTRIYILFDGGIYSVVLLILSRTCLL